MYLLYRYGQASIKGVAQASVLNSKGNGAVIGGASHGPVILGTGQAAAAGIVTPGPGSPGESAKKGEEL